MTSDQQQQVPSGLSVGIIPMSGRQARSGAPWTYTTGIKAPDLKDERRLTAAGPSDCIEGFRQAGDIVAEEKR